MLLDVLSYYTYSQLLFTLMDSGLGDGERQNNQAMLVLQDINMKRKERYMGLLSLHISSSRQVHIMVCFRDIALPHRTEP